MSINNTDGESAAVLAALAAACIAVACFFAARDRCLIQCSLDVPHVTGTLGSPTPIEEQEHADQAR